MSFPRIDDVRRTDQSFRNRQQMNHHKTYSEIERLKIDMVRDFPTSDPMHLLELGIMRRLLKFWCTGGQNSPHRLTDNDLIAVNRIFFSASRELPVEVHRSIRPLASLKHWKATEYRTILLYVGMIAFKDVLPAEEFQNFLRLICAVHICMTEKYRPLLRLAKMLFFDYIENYIHLHGIDSIGSNVHNICHIVEDVERFGNLMTISTYPFENSLRLIKFRMRTCGKPLEQISRRLDEIMFQFESRNQNVYINTLYEPELKHLTRLDDDSESFKTIKIKLNTTLSSRRPADKWFMTKNKEIIEFDYAIRNATNNIVLCGRRIRENTDFFRNPLSSSKLNIYQSLIMCARDEAEYFNLNTVMCKLICITYQDKLVFIPLLHTFD